MERKKGGSIVMDKQSFWGTAPTKNQTVDKPIRAITSEAIKQAEEQPVRSQQEGQVPPEGKITALREPAPLGQGGFGSVDEHSGSYAYRIPVHIPPPQNGGRSPDVSIVYNSMASAASSLIGAGWRLELGRIERVSQRGTSVDFKNNQSAEDANDHFVLKLNGRSYTLVNVHNHPNLFRAKIEDSYVEARRFLSSKIDPISKEPEIDYWVVILADGTKYRFGVEGSAGSEEVGGEFQNKVWNIVSIENTYGQKVLYEYEAYKNENNPLWKEKAYSYPLRIKCGVTPDEGFWDSVIEFVYTDEDCPDEEEGYYNLGIDYTGRELETGDGYTCILWKRLKEIRTSFRDENGKFLPSRSLMITADFQPQSSIFYIQQIQEVAYKNGKIDESARLPPHIFTYINQGEKNPALLERATTPMGKVEEFSYGLATHLDKGTPQAVDDVYLVKNYTERVEKESWTKTYEYWDGYNYSPFDEYRGHRRVDAIDKETGMHTETYYEQNGVHNGYIREQISYDTDKKKSSHLQNRWMALDYCGGRYMPFVQKAITRQYAENGKTVLSTVVTEIPKSELRNNPWEYAVDEYGNVLVQIETTYEGVYLFSWDDVPGDDSWQLINHLEKDLKIDWVENAEIKKSDDGKTITVTNGEKTLKFKLNEEENKVILEISGGKTHEYILKKENGKLNTYTEERHLVVQKKTETKYKNVDEGKHRLIGLPVEIKKFARESQSQEWLTEWTETKYNKKGQQIEQKKHIDRIDDNLVFKVTTEYHHVTGKKTKEFRYNGSEKLLVKETKYYEECPYQFLERQNINAKGHVEKLEEYDLQFRKPALTEKPDGIVEKTSYDGLGRTFEEIFTCQNPDIRKDNKDSVKYIYTVTQDELSIETVFIETGRRLKEYFDSINRKYKVTQTGYKGRKIVIKEQTEFDHLSKNSSKITQPHFEDTEETGHHIIEYDDPRLRRTKECEPDGKILIYKYDGFKETILEDFENIKNSNLPELTNTNVVSETLKDALDRVVFHAEGNPETDKRYEINYEYDFDNRLIKVTDNLGVTLKTLNYGEHLDDKPIAVFDVGIGNSELGYDTLRRLIISRRDFNRDLDRVSTINYDELDRVIEHTDKDLKNGSTRMITNEYDSAVNGVGQLAKQIVSESNRIGKLQHIKKFKYNAFGQPSKITQKWSTNWPDVNINNELSLTHSYVYNGLKGGRLEQIEHDKIKGLGGGITKYIYDDISGYLEEIYYNNKTVWKVPDGNFTAYEKPKQINLGNALTLVQDFEEKTGRLISKEVKNDHSNLLEYKLQYDNSGNVKKRTTHSLLSTVELFSTAFSSETVFDYDEKHQLINAVENGENQGFVYKANGIRIRSTGQNSEIEYLYNSDCPIQILSINGTLERNFSYDNAGNLLKDVNVKTKKERHFFWNPSNRIEYIEFDIDKSKRLCFGYDAENERVATYNGLRNEFILYADDVFEIIHDLDAVDYSVRIHILNGERRIATAECKADKPEEVYYYHRDLTNSILLVTDSAGNIKHNLTYSPFGKATSQKGENYPDILFIGHRADIIDYEGFSHYDFKARVYEPELGVFLSPDPTDDENNCAFGFNRYAYVSNNPISKGDPTGLQGDDEENLWGSEKEDSGGDGGKGKFFGVLSLQFEGKGPELGLGGGNVGSRSTTKTLSYIRDTGGKVLSFLGFAKNRNVNIPDFLVPQEDNVMTRFQQRQGELDEIIADVARNMSMPIPSPLTSTRFINLGLTQNPNQDVQEVESILDQIRGGRSLEYRAREMGFKKIYYADDLMRKEVVRAVDPNLYRKLERKNFWKRNGH
jgi:RHS repeat-associated protein